ncbi:unnamed protein product, partial [Discosporangium mesarthrocarpum]
MDGCFIPWEQRTKGVGEGGRSMKNARGEEGEGVIARKAFHQESVKAVADMTERCSIERGRGSVTDTDIVGRCILALVAQERQAAKFLRQAKHSQEVVRLNIEKWPVSTELRKGKNHMEGKDSLRGETELDGELAKLLGCCRGSRSPTDSGQEQINLKACLATVEQCER